MRILVILPTLLALAACGEAPEKAPVKREPAAETGAALEVAKLDERVRNGVFEKAIRASGEVDCLSVTHSERATMMNGASGWKADCNNDTSHLIEVLADGTAKVTSRSH